VKPAASSFVTTAMTVLPLAVAAMVVYGYAVARRRVGHGPGTLAVGVVVAAWMAGTYGLASSGLLARFEERPPPFAIFVVALVALSLAAGLSRVGGVLAAGLPTAALVGSQAFRLPLEIVMHRAAQEGTMPVQMSFAGWNYDVVTGSTAVIVSLLAATGRASRALVAVWNGLGALLLATIVGIAVVSTPLFAAWGSEPRHVNTWVAYPPFVWLPAVLVAAALVGHVVVARHLAMK
jgi:hypothetical protein